MPPRSTLCIVGLGYVGLPLAHAFAKAGHPVLGYDISEERVEELKQGRDRTNELSSEQLTSVQIEYSADPAIMKRADVIILAIPTPVDENNDPDLSLVESASRTVGQHLKKGAIVVYESTVYPGVTEELCGRVIEEESGLTCGVDFRLGYSPERINPGDREHTVEKIVKVVAGQDPKTTDELAELYGSVVKAGIHKASSIMVAEMAKAIENAQRDLNIAFVNEIAMLCNKLEIPTKDVLAAAGTKWNFLKFQPGLVGGHCIGVDPFYLVEVAKQFDMKTHAITAGRSVNDGMGRYIVDRVLQALSVPAQNAKVLVLGLTFKENVPDTRNSKSFDVIKYLEKAGCTVVVHDAEVDEELYADFAVAKGELAANTYDAIFLLVPHREYLQKPVETYVQSLKENGVFFDLKSLLPREAFTAKKRRYLAL